MEQQRTSETEEISLIDLIAVLVRHRRLIMAATLAAVVLAGIGVAFYPAYKLGVTERKRLVEANTSLMLATIFKSGLSEEEGSAFVLQSLNDPRNILAALRVAGYDSLGSIGIAAAPSEEKLLFLLRRRVIENKDTSGSALKETDRLFSVKRDKNIISVVFKNGSPEKASLFLSALTNIVERDFSAFIMPSVIATVESYEKLLSIRPASEAVEASIAQGYKDYVMAKALVAKESMPLLVLRQPYVYVPVVTVEEVRRGVLKMAVLAVIGVFFVAVFAAFIVHYVETVRADPDSMNKLRTAMRRS